MFRTTLLCFLIAIPACNAPQEKPRAPASQFEPAPKSEPSKAVFKPEVLSKIELIYKSETVILEKVPGGWRLPRFQNFPADAVYVEFLLRTLKNLPLGEVITNDANRFAEFRLDKPFVTIRLFEETGIKIKTIAVGKTSENYRSAYIRVDDRVEVLFVEADLYPATSRMGWPSRELWRVPAKLISHISWKSPQQQWRLEQRDNKWYVLEPAGKTLSSDFEKDILPKLAWLQGGYGEFRPGETLEGATLELTAAGAVFTMTTGALKDGNIAVRKEVDGLEQPITWFFSEIFYDMLNTQILEVD